MSDEERKMARDAFDRASLSQPGCWCRYCWRQWLAVWAKGWRP